MTAERSEESAEQALRQLCPLPLRLIWHENRSSFLSCRKEQGGVSLRLHRLFLHAPATVLDAVCRYIARGDRQAGSVVRQVAHLYFAKHRSLPEPLSSKGLFYDLQEIYLRIKKRYFQEDLCVVIGWSNRIRFGKFRHITFGSYDRHRNQIRIHPWLDDPDVPLYFLEFIVYHELLHAVCPSHIDARGAVRCHTLAFRRLEQRFAEFAIAKQWEKNSLKFFKKKVRNGRT